MSAQEIQTKVEVLDLDIDQLFGGTASAESITVPDSGTGSDKKSVNIFSKAKPADFSFTEPIDDGNKEITDDKSNAASNTELTGNLDKNETTNVDEFDSFTKDDDKTENRGRKKIEGIADVFSKLIKDEKIVPFDDDKPFSEYTLKDWEELIEANLEEKANQTRQETPKQFFESLPEELQIAARYVANGGTDLKSLFQTLAHVEETRDLDVKNEKDQEKIIRDYLHFTGYGSESDIEEEIEVWKDLGKLEAQANKFKPKLDKMREEVVAKKLEEQELRRKQQETASRRYAHNVYETLKNGELGEIKLDKKTQNMLFSGLVEPNYPSVSGRNTNLLGHLLEKYQFVEPNYSLISEALWLLSDPDGYKSKIMEKGSQKAVEATVRKLKIEQAANSSSSTGVYDNEESNNKRKIQRPNNFFKRF
jgi:hypothetical protein